MASTLGFVRNNPWILQDRMRRQIGAVTEELLSPVFANNDSESTSKYSSVSLPQTVSDESGSAAESCQSSGRSSPNEISYGPGMVRKLRERFLSLAQPGPSEKKRCASMDDLLGGGDSELAEQANISKQHSKSVSSLSDLKHSPVSIESHPEPFPQSSVVLVNERPLPLPNDTPSIRPTNLEVRLPQTNNNNVKEPEFLLVGRRLRRIQTPDSDLKNPPADPGNDNSSSMIVTDCAPPSNDQSPPPEEPHPPNVRQRIESEESVMSSDDEASYDVEARQNAQTHDAPMHEVQQLLERFGHMRRERELHEHPEPPKRRTLSAQFLALKQQTQPEPTDEVEISSNVSEADSESTTQAEEQTDDFEVERRGSLDVTEDNSDSEDTVTRSQIIAQDDDEMEVDCPFLIAGDGNPVRHTLLSLVSEEDVPELLEAMQEELHFEFEDAHGLVVGRGILAVEKKTEKGVVGFHADPPRAYAYPTEESDYDWQRGVEITNEQYDVICTQIRQETLARQMMEDDYLAELCTDANPKLGQPVVGGDLLNFVPRHLNGDEYSLGVETGSIEENDEPIESLRSEEQPVVLEERSFSSSEEKRSNTASC